MMDIVERLRRKEHDPYCGQCIDGRLSEEAAAEIEKLRKERDGLREALKKVDTLQMALLLIAEDGLHDPTVKNFIISALKGNE